MSVTLDVTGIGSYENVLSPDPSSLTSKKKRGRPRVYTLAQIRTLRKLSRSGMSVRAIAKAIGSKSATVQRELRRMRGFGPTDEKRLAEQTLLRKFGIRTEHLRALTSVQGGRCPICLLLLGVVDPVLDHKHDTNSPRGLLCDRCNLGLGNFKERPERLLRAALYLMAPGYQSFEVAQ